jgi:hypothetical protein
MIVQHDDARLFQKASRVWCSEVRALSRGWSLKKELPIDARLRARWGSLTSRIAAISPVATVGVGLLGGRTGVELVISLTGATAMPATQAIAQLRGGDVGVTAQPHENLEPETLESLQSLRDDFRKRRNRAR